MISSMSNLLAALVFSLGITILFIALAPSRAASVFVIAPKERTMNERIKKSLERAGFKEQTPRFVLFSLGGISFIVGIILSAIAGSFIAAIPAPLLVFAVFHMMLMRRQRLFMVRATNELIPFLNRMLTMVKAKRPIQEAYINAVNESNELKGLLENSAAEITSGRRFSDAILDTREVLPLRMWAVFVRQLELYEKTGGDVAASLEVSVNQINSMLQLQAEAQADFALQAQNQNFIVLVGLGGVLGYMILVDPGALRTLTTTFGGIVGLVLGLSVMAFGIWFGRKQMNDIARKLNF